MINKLCENARNGENSLEDHFLRDYVCPFLTNVWSTWDHITSKNEEAKKIVKKYDSEDQSVERGRKPWMYSLLAMILNIRWEIENTNTEDVY